MAKIRNGQISQMRGISSKMEVLMVIVAIMMISHRNHMNLIGNKNHKINLMMVYRRMKGLIGHQKTRRKLELIIK